MVTRSILIVNFVKKNIPNYIKKIHTGPLFQVQYPPRDSASFPLQDLHLQPAAHHILHIFHICSTGYKASARYPEQKQQLFPQKQFLQLDKNKNNNYQYGQVHMNEQKKVHSSFETVSC
jgi:hypothetical protein